MLLIAVAFMTDTIVMITLVCFVVCEQGSIDMRAVLKVRRDPNKKAKLNHIEGESSLHTASDEPLLGSISFRIAL